MTATITRRAHVDNHTYLPNAYNVKATERRRNVERRLESAVYMGAMFSAHLIDGRYDVVTASGTSYDGLSINEAGLVASFAMAAYREGRAAA